MLTLVSQLVDSPECIPEHERLEEHQIRSDPPHSPDEPLHEQAHRTENATERQRNDDCSPGLPKICGRSTRWDAYFVLGPRGSTVSGRQNTPVRSPKSSSGFATCSSRVARARPSASQSPRELTALSTRHSCLSPPRRVYSHNTHAHAASDDTAYTSASASTAAIRTISRPPRFSPPRSP